MVRDEHAKRATGEASASLWDPERGAKLGAMKASTAAAALVLLSLAALASPALAADAVPSDPELALHYDFFDVQGTRVSDGSGHDHTGTIAAGTIVYGKRKPAVKLEGAGAVTAESLGRGIDFAGRAMTVGAMCKPSAPDGVIVSMGDAMDGFSLYVQDGVPHFAVRTKGTLHEVVATDPINLDQWTHIAGVIGPKGGLSLLVNAWMVAERAEPSFLTRTPAGSFAVGADAGTPVGNDPAARHWQGLLEDVRLYRGAISRQTHRDLLGDWANRPGCGCRE